MRFHSLQREKIKSSSVPFKILILLCLIFNPIQSDTSYRDKYRKRKGNKPNENENNLSPPPLAPNSTFASSINSDDYLKNNSSGKERREKTNYVHAWIIYADGSIKPYSPPTKETEEPRDVLKAFFTLLIPCLLTILSVLAWVNFCGKCEKMMKEEINPRSSATENNFETPSTPPLSLLTSRVSTLPTRTGSPRSILHTPEPTETVPNVEVREVEPQVNQVDNDTRIMIEETTTTGEEVLPTYEEFAPPSYSRLNLSV